MNIHQNARLTRHSRAELVRRVLIERRSAHVGRDRHGRVDPDGPPSGWRATEPKARPGFLDRSSRPHQLRRPTPPETIEQIEALRRQRLDRQAHRHHHRRLGCDRQPGAEAPRHQQDEGARARGARPPIRTASTPASSSTSTSRSSAASTRSATASPAIAPSAATQAAAAPTSAGNIVLSASTTPRASRSAGSCPTRRRPAPSPSSTPRSLTMPASA